MHADPAAPEHIVAVIVPRTRWIDPFSRRKLRFAAPRGPNTMSPRCQTTSRFPVTEFQVATIASLIAATLTNDRSRHATIPAWPKWLSDVRKVVMIARLGSGQPRRPRDHPRHHGAGSG